MKNFGSILTFIAISAGVVSARALPASGDSIEARVPYPVIDELIARSPKKNKAAANSTADAAVAATSATAGKAKGAKAGKAAAGAAGNATAGAVDAAGAATNATKAAGGKKAGAGATKQSQNAQAAGNNNAQAAGNNDAQAQGGDLTSIVQGLTGINLGSLGLRSLPVLETRKGKKNATATVLQNLSILG